MTHGTEEGVAILSKAVGLVLVVAMLVGCASYKGQPIAVSQPGSMPVEKTYGELSISVDPYADKDRQKAAFDEHLYSKGFIVVNVLLKNSGPRQILVRRADLRLVLPDGTEVAPVSAEIMAVRFSDKGDVTGWTLGFGIIGGLAASAAAQQADSARRADYQSKEFKEEVTLVTDQSAHGFLYFMVSRGTQPFDEATLAVRVVDVEDGKSSVVSVPLTALKFPGTNK